MDELDDLSRKFVLDNNINREKEDLSYYNFFEIDFSTLDTCYSFFRSDFRGTDFKNVIFKKNLFDRADFISAFFNNVEFLEVDFGACQMKTCYLNKTFFKNNKYNFTSIIDCVFENCTFENEKLLINMLNCTFINCKFINVTFERSTTEKSTFEGCYFENVDFATMHAECHTLSNCEFNNFKLDFTYLFSYRIFELSFDDVELLYHGEKVPQTMLSEYTKTLYENKRFFEYINACVITKNFKLIEISLNKIFLEFESINKTQRKYQIKEIFEVLIFYTSKCVIPYNFIRTYISILSINNWNNYSIDERILYLGELNCLKNMFYEVDTTEDYIKSATSNYSLVTLKFETDDFEFALSEAERILSKLYSELGINNDSKLVKKEKGSWLLTFCTVSAVVLIAQKIALNQIVIANEYINTRFRTKALDKILEGVFTPEQNTLLISSTVSNNTKLAYETMDEFLIEIPK